MTMTRRWIAAAALAAGLSATAAGAALAHHSFSMFDRTKRLALKGEVVEFQWTNPHAWIELTIKGPQGPEKWSVELNSPNNLTRQGWNRNLLKPGDPINIVISPMKDGTKAGLFYSLVTAQGREVRDPSVPAGPITPTATRGS
jgi:hypothetical protein